MPGQGVVADGVKGVKKAPMPAEICKNDAKNRQFPTLNDLKVAEDAIFLYLKVLNKIHILPRWFLRNIDIFFLNLVLQTIRSFNLREPPAIRIRVKRQEWENSIQVIKETFHKNLATQGPSYTRYSINT